jgi:PKD repeat protein
MVRNCRILIAVAALALIASGCTVRKTERPALAGPSELGLSLNLTANPDILAQDGSSQSRVVILALDQNGAAVKGLPLHVEMSVNGVRTTFGELSTTDVATGSDGRATFSYTAPPLPPDSTDQGIFVTILVTPTGTDYANAVTRSVNIRLVPPGVVPPGPVASFTFSPAVVVPNAPVTFDATGSSSQGGTIIAYGWDFGDSSTGSGAKPQHIYRATGAYQVTLVVLDDQGRTSYPSTQTVTVDRAELPFAAFVFSPAGPVTSQPVFFDASTSQAGTGRRIVDYAWNFGNGASQHGVTATNSYDTAASYNVTLVVTDDVGQTASKSQTVPVGVAAPTASFVTIVVGPPSSAVSVDASASTPSPGQTITSYEWIFGDGTPTVSTTARTTSHTYPNPGTTGVPPVGRTVTYSITLTVIDSGGGRATVTRQVTITGF